MNDFLNSTGRPLPVVLLLTISACTGDPALDAALDFQTMRPGGKGPNDRARGSNMRPNQAGRRFGYNITLECQDGSDTYTVVIDPDMIITVR